MKNNFTKIFAIPTILLIALVGWYHFTESPMEKILILFICGTIIIPTVIQIFSMSVSYAIRPLDKNKREASKIIANKEKPHITAMTTPKTDNKQKKSTRVNKSQYYIPFRDSVSACSRNKLFTREDILHLDKCIDSQLGSHADLYNNNFTFANDMNKIYVKAKSSKLTDENYIYLLNVVSNIVNKNVKEEVQWQ